MAVALNSGVDYLFLDQQLQTNDEAIENFQANIMNLETDEDLDTDSIRDSAIDFWQSLSMSELEDRISSGIENFINLVALYLLKTILFPLGFFYDAIFVIKQLWRIELNAANPA